MTTLILISLIMVPIYLGWMALFSWPLFAASGVGAGMAYLALKDRILVKKTSKFLAREEVLTMVKAQTRIPWKDIYSSMELSCRSNQVSSLMHSLGVKDVDGLKYGSHHFNSTSYPDCYDLVTNLLDKNDSGTMNDQYQKASQFLRKGGIFVDIEDNTSKRSYQDHKSSAEKNGLSLVERSDRALGALKLVSQHEWLASAIPNASVLLVWTKA